MKVVYLLHSPGIASQTPKGWESTVISARPNGSYTEEDLKQVADADFLVVGDEPVSEDLLRRANRLRLIQRLGVGYDNVDVEAAGRNAAGSPSSSATR